MNTDSNFEKREIVVIDGEVHVTVLDGCDQSEEPENIENSPEQSISKAYVKVDSQSRTTTSFPKLEVTGGAVMLDYDKSSSVHLHAVVLKPEKGKAIELKKGGNRVKPGVYTHYINCRIINDGWIKSYIRHR